MAPTALAVSAVPIPILIAIVGHACTYYNIQAITDILQLNEIWVRMTEWMPPTSTVDELAESAVMKIYKRCVYSEKS